MHMHRGAGSDPMVANLSLNDPRCNSDDCLAFEAAHNYSQATVSYYYQYEYGHWTTWYYLIVIFLFMLIYAYRLWGDRKASSPSSTTSSVLQKVVAAWRAVSYRRYSGRLADLMGLPSMGIQLLLLGALVFAIVATFAARPYYRERRGFGSPPLAIRTALMSIALTPIIFALAGKVNLVTVLTGIGYEKLNVIHRWLSYLCFGLAVVHTVPFIVAPLREGGARALREKYYGEGAFEYTGTPPLAFLFFLVTFSIPYIRHRVYEVFVYSHWIAAIVYLGLMFWHAGNLEDSWAYLWASLALLLFSILGCVFQNSSLFSVRRSWLEGFPSTVQAIPGDVIKLHVLVPATYTWRVGQHCFLRIPTISVLDNHPFTIASLPDGASKDWSKGRNGDESNTLTFLIRPHSGFTHRLSSYAIANTDIILRTFIDGPYGGLRRKIENVYDSVILVAGGGGITASMPWLMHLAQCMRQGEVTVKEVKLIWVVRHAEHLQWAREELAKAVEKAPTDGALSFAFYVTHHGESTQVVNHHHHTGTFEEKKDPDAILTPTSTTLSSSTDEAPTQHKSHNNKIPPQHPSTLPNSQTHRHHGRPSLEHLITTSLHAPRTCVLGCGPESMKIDLSNAVARAQKRVLTGESKEVALYTETFGW